MGGRAAAVFDAVRAGARAAGSDLGAGVRARDGAAAEADAASGGTSEATAAATLVDAAGAARADDDGIATGAAAEAGVCAADVLTTSAEGIGDPLRGPGEMIHTNAAAINTMAAPPSA